MHLIKYKKGTEGKGGGGVVSFPPNFSIIRAINFVHNLKESIPSYPNENFSSLYFPSFLSFSLVSFYTKNS